MHKTCLALGLALLPAVFSPRSHAHVPLTVSQAMDSLQEADHDGMLEDRETVRSILTHVGALARMIDVKGDPTPPELSLPVIVSLDAVSEGLGRLLSGSIRNLTAQVQLKQKRYRDALKTVILALQNRFVEEPVPLIVSEGEMKKLTSFLPRSEALYQITLLHYTLAETLGRDAAAKLSLLLAGSEAHLLARAKAEQARSLCEMDLQIHQVSVIGHDLLPTLLGGLPGMWAAVHGAGD